MFLAHVSQVKPDQILVTTPPPGCLYISDIYNCGVFTMMVVVVLITMFGAAIKCVSSHPGM